MKHAVPLALLLASLGAGAAVAATATAADRSFVAKVSQGGMFEVAAGKLAETRGFTQDVRDFAVAEVHDHTLKLAHLSSLSGKAFDTAYLGEMAALHDADGAAFAKEATDGGSPAYRAFGAETHRIVQRHIGAIRALPAT